MPAESEMASLQKRKQLAVEDLHMASDDYRQGTRRPAKQMASNNSLRSELKKINISSEDQLNRMLTGSDADECDMGQVPILAHHLNTPPIP